MMPRTKHRPHVVGAKPDNTGLAAKLKPIRTQLILGAVGTALLAGGITYWAMRPPPPPARIIPKDATREQERELAANLKPGQEKQFREERRELDDARRQKAQADMAKRAAEYAGLKTQAERDAFLDKQLDEMQNRRREMEQRMLAEGRTPGQRGTPPGGGPGGPPPGAAANPAGAPAGGPPGEGGGRRGPPSEDRRNQAFRERLDNSTPAERAQMQQMFDALRKRAEAKGISMGGPGGGGGGFGGGRRGGGGR